MTRKSQETFHAICDSICSSPSYANAARVAHVSINTIWNWIGQSQRDAAGNGLVIEEYMGMRDIPLHLAMQAARRAATTEIVNNLEHRALHGHDTQVIFGGRPQWVEDESLSHLSDADLATFGINDRWLRDENGKRVALMEHHEPPVALALAVAAAAYPRVYGSHSEISVTHGGNLGVSVVRRSYDKPAPQQVEIVEQEQIEHHPRDAVDLDANAAADLDADIHTPAPDVLDEAGLARAEAQQTMFAAPQSLVEPEPAPVATPEPAAVREGRPLTALEKDLLSRMRAKAGSAERVAPVPTPEQAYDPPDRIGVGKVPPGGFRSA